MGWPFGSAGRESPSRPTLRVAYAGRQILEVYPREVPCDKRLIIDLHQEREQSNLEFVNSYDRVLSFDLASVWADGAKRLYLSIPIGPSFAVQPDCLLSTDFTDPTESFRKCETLGVRMQPFYLPETPGRLSELVGRGLFYRGFHFSGVITPGNVSLLCLCDSCQKTFRLQSFHSGFSSLVYFYCSRGPHTLVVSSFLKDAPPWRGDADKRAVGRFESHLPACQQCGGEFRYMNSLLCPYCLRPYIDFLRHPGDRRVEYYGNHLYGQDVQKWLPE